MFVYDLTISVSTVAPIDGIDLRVCSAQITQESPRKPKKAEKG